MFRFLWVTLLSLFLSNAYAVQEQQPPSVGQVFQLSVHRVQKNQLIVEWNIAPGYYLYRNAVKIVPTATNPIKLDPIQFPAGAVRHDELHGQFQAYTGLLKVPVTLTDGDQGELKLKISYQGCSEAGFCYSPQKKYLRVNLAKASIPADFTAQIVEDVGQEAAAVEAPSPAPATEQDQSTDLFYHHGFFFIVLSFFGIGLLLSLTPCVLPMIPILSGLIIGQGKISTAKAFSLSLAYVVGMAVTYAIAGVFVAMVGSSIQTALQQPWVIVLFSAFFVVLAFSLFGFYELQLPASLQGRLTALSNRQKSGSYIGVFVMGCLASLVVSPCVSAPLVGVLTYIAHTGNILLGGMALLAMGFGMGFPLLLIGTSAGKLLPKSGAWMTSVKNIFGILMLAFAIWMLARIVHGPVILVLWGILLIAIAMFMDRILPTQKQWKMIGKTLSVISMVYGIVLLSGSILKNSSPLHPWAGYTIVHYHIQHNDAENSLAFVVVKNMAQFDAALADAAEHNKKVMLDFYADWCTSCVVMDKHVFTKAETHQALKDFVLLRSDLTANNAFDHALLKRFNVVAPPTILFFHNGKELSADRIVGEVNVEEFLARIKKVSHE